MTALEWLDSFQAQKPKDPNYAEKTLAAYQLGMKARGSILGVVIHTPTNCCDLAKQLSTDRVYKPAEAPRLPLPGCPQGNGCGCVYRPWMNYQQRGATSNSDE